jgi:hypothetical protein
MLRHQSKQTTKQKLNIKDMLSKYKNFWYVITSILNSNVGRGWKRGEIDRMEETSGWYILV